MAQNKTTATRADASAYVAAIADDARRSDCDALLSLMTSASGHPPTMWGTAIVGFGLHTYPLASGKMGETCAVGFSSRKGDISIYGITDTAGADALLAQLGKHKRAKSCLYVARMADIDATIMAKLVALAIKAKTA